MLRYAMLNATYRLEQSKGHVLGGGAQHWHFVHLAVSIAVNIVAL
jgi:hypothetical protein